VVALAALLAPHSRSEAIELTVGLPLGRTLLGFDPLSGRIRGHHQPGIRDRERLRDWLWCSCPRAAAGRTVLPAFIAGMNLVLLAQDAFSFLVGWEFMSLASWALVVSEHTSEDNRRAALVYLIMATAERSHCCSRSACLPARRRLRVRSDPARRRIRRRPSRSDTCARRVVPKRVLCRCMPGCRLRTRPPESRFRIDERRHDEGGRVRIRAHHL